MLASITRDVAVFQHILSAYCLFFCIIVVKDDMKGWKVVFMYTAVETKTLEATSKALTLLRRWAGNNNGGCIDTSALREIRPVLYQ